MRITFQNSTKFTDVLNTDTPVGESIFIANAIAMKFNKISMKYR